MGEKEKKGKTMEKDEERGKREDKRVQGEIGNKIKGQTKKEKGEDV